jgi:large subunit ribosomal protein L4
MSNLPIKDQSGAEAGEYSLSDDLLVFDKGSHAVHQAVVAYLSNQRQGSASTLGKGEVRGSNKKLWKQKGTGRARVGFRQNPIWRGGGVAHGPTPAVNWRKNMTKKTLKLAFRRAFSEMVSSGDVTVLDSLTLSAPKTKEVASLLKSLNLDRSVLIVTAQHDAQLVQASRNIPRVEVVSVDQANVYQVVRYSHIIITKDALAGLEGRLQPVSGKEA